MRRPTVRCARIKAHELSQTSEGAVNAFLAVAPLKEDPIDCKEVVNSVADHSAGFDPRALEPVT